ncbi:MAG: trypsin-like peptidase domain-containing protein [Phycisphaerales bacterium]
MRRIVSFGPAFVVLLTAGVVLVAMPGLMMRASAARARERVALARQELDADDVLERLNKATQHVADAVEPSVVHLDIRLWRGAGASGSGWVFDDDGHIVTNAHVVGPANRVDVQFVDGRVETGQVVGVDALTDIAVLKVPAGDYLVPVRRATGERVHRGDRVFAFGSPFNFKFSMSEGIVSGLGRTARGGAGAAGITNYIQTDAAVNPGNSGGPLVDVNGRVVGMNVAIATAENASGGTEGQSAGISFAIPLATIEPRVQAIIDGQKPRSGYLGVSMDLDIVRFGGDHFEGQGVRVTLVQPGSPAEKAGMVAGDVIVGVDGEGVDGRDLVRALIGAHRPGSNAVVKVYRGGTGDVKGEFVDLNVAVGAMPDDVLALQYLGMFGERFGVFFHGNADASDEAMVIGVAPSGAGADAGFESGDVIIRVEGKDVKSIQEAMLALEDAGAMKGSRVGVTVRRRAADGTAAEKELRLRRRAD